MNKTNHNLQYQNEPTTKTQISQQFKPPITEDRNKKIKKNRQKTFKNGAIIIKQKSEMTMVMMIMMK